MFHRHHKLLRLDLCVHLRRFSVARFGNEENIPLLYLSKTMTQFKLRNC